MRPLVPLFLAAAAQAAGTFQVLWTTDSSGDPDDANAVFGPDGPWQAIYVGVGSSGESRPMWPSGGGTTMALTQLPGGAGSIANSSTALRSNVSMASSDDWFSSIFVGDEPSGFGVVDTVDIIQKVNGQHSQVNTTIVAVETWPVNFANNSTYSARVGILGLGPSADKRLGSLAVPAGILSDLKSRGDIASLSFGLHIGSVPFKQRGSLVLGGHERNRALGPVGVFRYDTTESAPLLLLLDVLLGTHIGGSPFSPPISETTEHSSTSVWRGVGDNFRADEITKRVGGKPGSAVIMVNPAAPYMYLPPGTCEAAAAHLPVTFSPELNLFLWDTSSAAYGRIINSPSYLAFVFADRTATNITIKVPFHLLNLTLEAPLVATPTQYFPCRPLDSAYGFWMLGRAFLQAAFLGVDYERNLTYLAQAPGPDMEQSVLVERPAGREGLESNPIEEWESSWMKRWTVLAANEEFLAEQNGNGNGNGLGVGATVGVVMGVLAFVVAACVGGWYWWKTKRGGEGITMVPGQEEPKEEWARGYQGFAEVDGGDRPVEVPPKMMVHEMEAPHVTHEAPGNGEFWGEGGHAPKGQGS
ncbi:aspartic peptidase domain-containing protein [Schizothecium vesticola]|uniref:Aspartic peptidase domain-containing protein n=1 Tax=Schizothecium vesticola TaxID=314040 RepID=A0AA40K388_9PEZI|nr:aspartic peptidase domain-containing protein [Schizothecium vesticola]